MAESRCWPGYEPVKGKKQNEEGSCRPKAESKETGTEKKFRAKRKQQLDAWQEEHPKTPRSAAQHLPAPGAKPKAKKAKATKKSTAGAGKKPRKAA